MFKWINKAIVFIITMTGVYIFSDNLITTIQPCLLNGWIRIIQLFTFGFGIGFVGAMAVDNVIKIILSKFFY
jgi:hypothetical protein